MSNDLNKSAFEEWPAGEFEPTPSPPRPIHWNIWAERSCASYVSTKTNTLEQYRLPPRRRERGGRHALFADPRIFIQRDS